MRGQIGGSMGGTSRPVTLKAMPYGRFRGTAWQQIPPRDLEPLLAYWNSEERNQEPMREAIVNALTDEWVRRASRRKKCPKPRKRWRRPKAKAM